MEEYYSKKDFPCRRKGVVGAFWKVKIAWIRYKCSHLLRVTNNGKYTMSTLEDGRDVELTCVKCGRVYWTHGEYLARRGSDG